jgi:hypothetical protein
MRVGTKQKTKDKLEIEVETTRIYSWECPICGEKIEMESTRKTSFINGLIRDHQVRYVNAKHFAGLICGDCVKDPETENFAP